MSALAKIHVAKKQLGLDEDTYRAVLVRAGGQASAKGMSEAQLGRVLEEFKRLGFKPTVKAASNGRRKALEGKFAPKLQALWIAGWNLGIVRNRDDKALLAFVKRQTGLDHTRFLHHPEDAARAIEALKGWLAREGGVDWSPPANGFVQLNGYRIAKAQWVLLGGDPAEFLQEACSIAGHNSPSLLQQESDWQPGMNAFGRRIRAAKKEA